MIWFMTACFIVVALIAQHYRAELHRAYEINSIIAQDLLKQYETIDEIISLLTEGDDQE